MPRQKNDSPIEWCIIALLGFILCVGPLVFGGAYTSGFLLLSSLTAVALGFWFVLILSGKRYRLLWPPVCWIVLGFLAYSIWEYRFAPVSYSAEYEIMRVFLYAAVFVLAVNFLHGQETTQMLSLLLVFLGMVLASYALFQYITHSDKVWHITKPAQYMGRGSGSYICPNHLAGFLEMVLPLGLAYLFAGRLNTTFKVFLGYACLVIIAGIGVTMSRGGWLATGVSIMAFLVMLLGHRKYRIQAGAALLCFLIGGFLVFDRSDGLKERLNQTLERDSNAPVSVRSLIWESTVDMWKDHQWIGEGPGQFDHAFQYHRHPEVQERPGWVHNDFLHLLVEYGIIGFGLFGAGLLLLAAGAWKTRKYVLREARDFGKNRHSNRAACVLGCSISLLAISVHSVFDFNMYIPANGLLAVALAGILVSHLRFTTERYWWKSNLPNRLIACILVLGITVFMGAPLWARFQEARLLKTANAAEPFSTERMDALVKATQIMPSNFETPYQVGEVLMGVGQQFEPGYEERLEVAIQWFEKSLESWPDYSYPYAMIGRCLDFLGRTDEATPYFERALALDPNNIFVVAYMGLHELERGDFKTAHDYFEQSWNLRWYGNFLAQKHLIILKKHLGLPPLLDPITGDPYYSDVR
jgi:O-antigen ligase